MLRSQALDVVSIEITYGQWEENSVHIYVKKVHMYKKESYYIDEHLQNV